MIESVRAESTTPRHPIAVVSERTGLSQDILRVWERRYGAVQPARTEGGQRLYSDADVARLRLLDAAVAGGRRIGNIAKLETSALAELVAEDTTVESRRSSAGGTPPRVDDAPIDLLLDRVRALDWRGLDDLLRRRAALVGVPSFLEDTAAPLLRRIGDDWYRGRVSVAQEHVASAVVSDIVSDVMRSMSATSDALRLVVGTPAGSRHVIGAMLVGATAAADGWDVLYVGGDLPVAEMVAAAKSSGADAVAVSVVYSDDNARTLDELRALKQQLPSGTPLLVGGRAAAPIARELSAIGSDVGATLGDLRQTLARIARRSAR